MLHGGQDDAYVRYRRVPALCNPATVARILGMDFGNPRGAHFNESRVRRRENYWQAEKHKELDPALV